MNLNIQAQKRELGKKSDLNKLRRDGFVPAVVYGEGKEGKPIFLNYREFFNMYKQSIGHMAFFVLEVEGEKVRTILKDKQIHPVTRQIIHIDFQELHAGKEIIIDVPLNFEGEAPGIKEGGMLDIQLRHISCSSLPKNIKDDIVVDLTVLGVGDVITVGDLDLGEMTSRAAEELAVASVHLPRAAKAADGGEEEGEEAGEEADE